MTKFRVTPLGSKDKTRISQHGKLWENSKLNHIDRAGFKLLDSCKTGYTKWWRDEQIKLVQTA